MNDHATHADTSAFPPDYHGNMAGRPRFSRHRASVLRDLVDSAEAASIARMVIDRAYDGDSGALRLCFTRLFPPAKEGTIVFALPAVASPSDAVAAGAALLAGAAAGDIPAGDARTLMALLATQFKLLQGEARLAECRSEAAPKPVAPGTAPPSQSEKGATPASGAARPEAEPTCISPVIAVGTEGAARFHSAPPEPLDAHLASRNTPQTGTAGDRESGTARACISPVLSDGLPLPCSVNAAASPSPATAIDAPPVGPDGDALAARVDAAADESLHPASDEGPEGLDPGWYIPSDPPPRGIASSAPPIPANCMPAPARDLALDDERTLFLIPPFGDAASRWRAVARLLEPACAGTAALAAAAAEYHDALARRDAA